jgi:hypothetical protein
MADNVAGGMSGIVEMDSDARSVVPEHARQGLRTEMHSTPRDAGQAAIKATANATDVGATPTSVATASIRAP